MQVLLVVKDYVRPPDALVGYADDVDATCEKNTKERRSAKHKFRFWGEKNKNADRNRKSSRSGDCRSIFESANSLLSGFDYVRPADGAISQKQKHEWKMSDMKQTSHQIVVSRFDLYHVDDEVKRHAENHLEGHRRIGHWTCDVIDPMNRALERACAVWNIYLNVR